MPRRGVVVPVALAALVLAAGVVAVMVLRSGEDDAAAGAAASAPVAQDFPRRAAAQPAPEAPARAKPKPRAETAAERRLERGRRLQASIHWRRSESVGRHDAGRLVAGVRLPPEGVDFFTWDPVRWRSPNRPDRLHGNDRLVRTILTVAKAHRGAHPGAPRLAIGDMSRPGGGSFDARHGALAEFGHGRGTLGHVSHQSGLDVDVYYPRRDRKERAPDSLADIDLVLAQDLVDRFVAAGAKFVFVGPSTGLEGPAGIVQPLVRHDDHLHVRLP